MSPADFDALLGRLGLSRAAAARLMGRDVRTVRRWLEGTREMSDADAAILRLLDERAVSRKRVARIIQENRR